MKKLCKNCNKVYSQDDIFCTECGSKLIEIHDDTPPKTNAIDASNTNVHARNRQFNKHQSTEDAHNVGVKDFQKAVAVDSSPVKKSNKRVIILIILLVLVLVGTVLTVAVIKLTSPQKFQDSLVCLSDENGQPVVFTNNQYYSDFGNGSVIAYDYNDYMTAIGILDEDRTLWLVNQDGKFRIDDDVYSFEISNDGNSVLYSTSWVDNTLERTAIRNNPTISYSTGYLKEFKTSDNASQIIDNDIIITCDMVYQSFFTISQHGSAVCYAKDMGYNKDSDSVTWKNYVYYDGTSANFTNQSFVYAINDDATICYWDDTNKKSIYYGNILTNNINKLYTYDQDDKSNYTMSLFFNRDCSQCIATMDYKTYIIDGQNEKEILGSFRVDDIYNGSSGMLYSLMVNTDSFNGCILDGSKEDNYDKHYYLTKDSNNSWMCSELSDKSYYGDISADTKYIYGTKKSTSSGLYKTSVTDPTDETEIALHVSEFVVSQNEKYVYYITESDELYCYDGKESTRIDIDVHSVSEQDNTFYYLKDVENYCGTLYSSSAGKAGQRVSNGNDVFGTLFTCKTGMLFVSVYDINNSYEGTLYMVKDGVDVVKLQEDIVPYSPDYLC